MIDPDELDEDRPRADATVHGVVLAAGTSDRYGDRNKLLASLEGESIVRRAVRPLLKSDLDGVTVVLGHDADRVRKGLSDLPVSFGENDRYHEGQGTSISAGVAVARERGADAVLIALGDMPHVSPDSIAHLLEAYRAGAGSALAAACAGERGNPVVFDRQHFDALARLDGDRGGRDILLSVDDATLVETSDPGVLRDIDQPADR
jgi:molybdenum cofactor cytidylyltransferase